jgi:8-oxo-dGTP pyrophosphatase MutT (NUDIX family)
MPVPVNDAATLMLVRDADDPRRGPGIEVCMLRRALDAGTGAGAYVFPGGSVDSDDRGPALECVGRTDADASARLGIESGGLRFWVTAIRECFEEAGVLLAHRLEDVPDPDPDPEGRPLAGVFDPVRTERWTGLRREVNAGRMRFSELCRSEGLVLAVGSLYLVSRWITPELLPRRFDTCFFVAAAPAGQVAYHDGGETIETIWVRPADALARQQSGELQLFPPTLANLGTLVPFHATADVMAWAATITEVAATRPLMVIEDGRQLVLRPGDVGYQEALAAQHASEVANP